MMNKRTICLLTVLGGIFIFQKPGLFAAHAELEGGHSLDEEGNTGGLREHKHEAGREPIDYLRTLGTKGPKPTVFLPTKLQNYKKPVSGGSSNGGQSIQVVHEGDGFINVSSREADAIRRIAQEVHDDKQRSRELINFDQNSDHDLMPRKRQLFEQLHSEVMRVLDKQMHENPKLFEKLSSYKRINKQIYDFQMEVVKADNDEQLDQAVQNLDDIVEKIRGEQLLMLAYRDRVQSGKKRQLGLFGRKPKPTAEELKEEENTQENARNEKKLASNSQNTTFIRLRNFEQKRSDIVRARDQKLEELKGAKKGKRKKIEAQLKKLALERAEIDQQISTLSDDVQRKDVINGSHATANPTNASDVFDKGSFFRSVKSPFQLREDMRLESITDKEKQHNDFYNALKTKVEQIVKDRKLSQGGKFGDADLVRKVNKKLQKLAKNKWFNVSKRNEKLKDEIDTLVDQVHQKIIQEQSGGDKEGDLTSANERKINQQKTRFALYQRPKNGDTKRVPADVVLAQDSNSSGKPKWNLQLNRVDGYLDEKNRPLYDEIVSNLKLQMDALDNEQVLKPKKKKLLNLYDQINEQLEELAQPGLSTKQRAGIEKKIKSLLKRATKLFKRTV